MDILDINQCYYLIRIIVAGICGLVIGMERKNRSKEAGVRTHFVVACGAAVMMIVSKYAFGDVLGSAGLYANDEVRLDPSRVASTIASGIGFLGAGMIFVHKNTITGLTTAAGIWATSGIGMSIGAGMYVIGIGSTIIILLAQYLLHIDFHRAKNYNLKTLSIKDVTQQNYQSYITERFGEKKILVQSVAVESTKDGNRNYTFKIEIPPTINEDEIISMIEYKSSISQAH